MPSIKLYDKNDRVCGIVDYAEEFTAPMADGTTLRFEYHEYFGPSILDEKGDIINDPTDAQWEAFNKWFEETHPKKQGSDGGLIVPPDQ